jgi:hypothetical protein
LRVLLACGAAAVPGWFSSSWRMKGSREFIKIHLRP